VVRLVPERALFFDLYGEAAANVVAIADLLVQLLDRFPEHNSLSRDIKELEHHGDRLTHDVVSLLNRTFVTPFDRYDMYQLATALDDVCDHIDEAAGNVLSYGISEIRPQARAQAEVIHRSATKLQAAVGCLHGFKDASRQLDELRELEDEGDRLNREAVSDLFRTTEDAVEIIRWKDIHEQLEEAVDACENAADVLEAIFVKNR
jgi:uncharacterized protein